MSAKTKSIDCQRKIEIIVVQYGVAAERATITPSADNAGMEFRETDTGNAYESDGVSWNQISTDGADHVTDPAYDYAPTYNDGTYKYYPKTHVLGSAVSAAVWQITRMRISDGQTSYAGSAGSFGKFDQVATEAGLAALTYSQT